MGTWARPLGISALVAAVGAGCLPGSGPALNPYQDDAGAPPPIALGDDASSRGDVDLGDPFAVTGLQPSHGPWTGGTRTTIAGRGFSSRLRVWIGPTELDPSDILASDPTRASIVTPAGAPGPADVRVENATTAEQRVLSAGFFYDDFVVQPSGGATSGGTRIALYGNATQWTSSCSVAVGGKACTDVAFVDATHLSCTTPPNAPGSQDVMVTDAAGAPDQARDAFTYSDSPDGYRGGLYGGALSGNLKVLAFDNWTGTPLAGGKAIAGSSLASAIVGVFDAGGVTQLSDASLRGKVTVTVVAKCHQPMTFVDVPVDTVTTYLNPVLDPSCTGDPPSTGNWLPAELGEMQGELVWSGGIEFQRSPWNNVPQPIGPNEHAAAYVFTATGNPFDTFVLPPATNATTPNSPGRLGYAYSLPSRAGNQTVYALAGIEDDSVKPPTFDPYVMGVVRGVPLQPGTKVVGVDIPMTTLLDHVVTAAPLPPPATPRGPDRLVSAFAVSLGSSLFALLPQGTTTSPLPISGKVPFAGAPALDGTLAGAAYDLSCAAVTGPSRSVPLSVVTRVETVDANEPVTVGGFFAIPTIVQPSTGTWAGTHVQLLASGPVDLALVNISSGNGLVAWLIVAPGNDLSFDLPDISQVNGAGSLVHGAISTTFSVARMDRFDYGQLRFGQLSSGAWNAYAADAIQGSY